MKEKIEKFWTDHKTKILVGGGIIIGGAVIFVMTRSAIKLLAPTGKVLGGAKSDFWWNFDNFEDAVSKFKEIEEVCINLGKDEVALFGGGYGPNAGKYTVMHL